MSAFSARPAFCSVDSWTGSIAPFCTRLPIQSCAPTITSGPLPCWEAVTKVVCWSLEIAWILTVTPFSVPNLSANGLRAAARLSSAQMTSLPPAAWAEGVSALGLPLSLPQPAASRATVIAAAARPAARMRIYVS